MAPTFRYESALPEDHRVFQQNRPKADIRCLRNYGRPFRLKPPRPSESISKSNPIFTVSAHPRRAYLNTIVRGPLRNFSRSLLTHLLRISTVEQPIAARRFHIHMLKDHLHERRQQTASLHLADPSYQKVRSHSRSSRA